MNKHRVWFLIILIVMIGLLTPSIGLSRESHKAIAGLQESPTAAVLQASTAEAAFLTLLAA